jgi:hypothetical protein
LVSIVIEKISVADLRSNDVKKESKRVRLSAESMLEDEVEEANKEYLDSVAPQNT